MSIEKGRAFFRKYGIEDRIIEPPRSSATVELAAEAVGVEPARIAKTLAFKTQKGCMLLVTAGDARVDNKKFRKKFGIKARMLPKEDLPTMVGYPVGGVCPFGINEGVSVYLDISMKRFDTVFPAVGSANSAVELPCDELFKYSLAKAWVDVCL